MVAILKRAKPAPLTDERVKAYTWDIIRFLEEQYICAETGKLFVCEPFQRTEILEPIFYDLDDEGLRKYTLALLGMPKKFGKSTILSGIGVWFCFQPEPHGEIIVGANNLDQASLIIYDKIKNAIKDNPNLKTSATILKNKIIMKGTETTCRPIAAKYETAAGVNPTLVLFDELWGFPGRKFYDELTTSPARKNPLTVIGTYAGYDKDSLLYELYEMGRSGEDPTMFYRWLTSDIRPSWITQKYLDTQKRRLPPNSYARFHDNKWASADSTFITDDDVAKLHVVPWVKQEGARPDGVFDYVVTTDLGLSHDRAARAVGHYNHVDSRVYVDSLKWWEGSKKAHVDIESVEVDLWNCKADFGVNTFVIDPWQMENTIQRLRKQAWTDTTITPFNFNTDVVPMSNLLVQLLREGRLVCYDEPQLDKELLEAVSKETNKGWRIEHVKGKRNDLVIVVGMLCMAAMSSSFATVDMPGNDEFKTPAIMHDLLKREF